MKRFTSCALALTLSAVMLLLSACGPTGSPSDGNGGNDSSGEGEGGIHDTLVVANSNTMDEFDPQEMRSAYLMYGPMLTHMTLVRIDGATKEVVPYLAESFEFDEAASSYIFHLLEEAVFSTGEPVTADDVVFTLERAKESTVSAPNVACVTQVTAVDEHTVSVTVTQPSLEFLYNMTMSNFGILSRKACEEDPEAGFEIGCGPYTQIEWEPDNYTLYQRVEDYWNGTAPSKYIRYMKIAEASSRAIALQTGEVDIDLSLSVSEVSTVEADENCKVYVEDGTILNYLFFNLQGENEALKDQRVRQAIACAINPEEIILGALEGYGAPSPVIPVATVDTSAYDCTITTQDLEKAKALLAEAGYADGFDMTIHHNSISHGRMVEIIQSQLAQVGIHMTVACADRTQMYSEWATGMGYESGMTNMTFSCTPGRLSLAIYGTGEVANYTNYGSAEADALMNTIFTTNSLEERAEAAYELNELMTEECVFIPLYVQDTIYGVRSNVKDLEVYDGSTYLDFAYAYAED